MQSLNARPGDVDVRSNYDALVAHIWRIIEVRDEEKRYNRIASDKQRGWGKQDTRGKPGARTPSGNTPRSGSGDRRNRDQGKRPPPKGRAAAAADTAAMDTPTVQGNACAANSDGTPVSATAPGKRDKSSSYRNRSKTSSRSPSTGNTQGKASTTSTMASPPSTASPAASGSSRPRPAEHPQTRGRSPASRSPSTMSQQDKQMCRSRGLCVAFQSGKCTRGDACRYKHERLGGSRGATPGRTSRSRSGSNRPSAGQQGKERPRGSGRSSSPSNRSSGNV